ncbi:MAG: hypothetical protein K6343_05325 [Caldisericaceae bacterium]
MNNGRVRKIGALVILGIAIIIFAISSILLIKFRLYLPPTYTVSNEGRFVAYGVMKFVFLLTIPIVISLLLIAYLIYPSKSEKLSKTAKILCLILAIVGFGVGILFVVLTIRNNPSQYGSLRTVLISILSPLPFWLMGILSLFTFKKIGLKTYEKEI